MFIPRSVGRLTGWKAVVGVIVIVGISGLGIWSKMQPRTFGQGTWDIPPGKAMFYSIKAKHPAKFKADFTPQGPTAASDTYTIYMLDEANRAKLQNPTLDRQAIQKMISVDATGPRSVGLLSLDVGTYYVVAENRGKTSLALKYVLYEVSE